jgi:hypothetical protein
MDLNPEPEKEVESPSAVTRKVLCVHYDECLNTALKKQWSGFTCSRCACRQQLSLSSEEWRHDAIACKSLLLTVEYRPANWGRR